MTVMPAELLVNLYERLGQDDKALITRMIALMPSDRRALSAEDEDDIRFFGRVLPKEEATEEELEMFRMGDEQFANGEYVTYTREELIKEFGIGGDLT